MITPRFYFQRGQKSDRDWIERCLHSIPENRHAEISSEYEKLYENQVSRHSGRKFANTFLLAVAQEYRRDEYVKKNQK